MLVESNDCEVIEGCKRGEPDAFLLLFNAHKDKVYSIAFRYSGNEAVALDIAQETFLKLFSVIGDFRGDASFDSWLYRLVVNHCIDDKRRGRRLVAVVEGLVDAIWSSSETTLEDLLRSEVEENVQVAINKLPEEQRIVIVLRYTESLSYEEIAQILGCSQGTVASRLNRAHKALERRLSHLRKGWRA
jgi:RNA polymerase sigma-70 factor (ECF subfamily)